MAFANGSGRDRKVRSGDGWGVVIASPTHRSRGQGSGVLGTSEDVFFLYYQSLIGLRV